MRILVLSNEVWNDKINGNNVTSNWFEGMNADFANIYASPDSPDNKCCDKYFQITDKMMLRSIFTKNRAGKELELRGHETVLAEAEPKKLYGFLKKISGSFVRFARECLWLVGNYDYEAMSNFINEFKPDIVFSERMATCKMLRLEKVVSSITDAPIVAFTGDDEYSLRRIRISPFFWINRIMIRNRLREMVKKYKIYYTLSYEQLVDYERRFECKMKILQKCGDFPENYRERQIHNPIKIIYAGKFYCNRWKVLAQIADELRRINEDGVRVILEIYTRDVPTRKQKELLDDRRSSFIMGGVSQEELKIRYNEADIALHVESCDLKNRLDTRLSFSTKIVDCIASGCAVLAYCWEKHAGLTYLKREDAAICVSSKMELRNALEEIVNHKEIIASYAKKAYECGIRNHRRDDVQRMLLADFESIIIEGVCNENIAN